ncbi:MAG: hypothetical protein AAF135_21730 [Bacteroidota bacterium]
MKSLLYFFLCWGLSLSLAWAQMDDLTQDQSFFLKQAELYQTWLERQGIAQHIQVREMEIQKDKIALYLEFVYQDLDSMVNAWDQIKTSFETRSSITFEEHLFYKFILLMEVRQGAGNIQIYNTYDLRREPLFFRGIYFDTEKDRVDVATNDPKSQIAIVNIPHTRLRNIPDSQGMVIDHEGSKKSLFEDVLRFADKEFMGEPCRERYPEIEVLENNENLRFRIQDLCKEVLIEETQTIICKIFDCNYIRREMLEFLVTYQETSAGAQLKVTIDGKFGSGYFSEVKRGAYQDMEAVPELKKYLIDYANKVEIALQAYLAK